MHGTHTPPPRPQISPEEQQRLADYQSFLAKQRKLLIEDLFAAITSKNEVKALWLMDAGADINNDWLLRLTCVHGLEKVALRLIDAGADVNAADKHNNTPLYFACENRLEKVALRLIEVGANVNAKNYLGETPLHQTCWKALENVALRLIEAGADVNARDGNGKTPLHGACSAGLEKVALRLIKAGADVNAKDDRGFAPHRRFFANDSIRDMGREFASHVFLPLLVGGQSTQKIKPEITDEIIKDLTTTALKALCPEPDVWNNALLKNPQSAEVAAFMRPLRLSRTWHHGAITFPAALRPLWGKREWHALMPEMFDAGNGLSVHCLTSSAQLKDESRQLDHCVGRSDYDQHCCGNDDKRSHIFSVRDSEGHSLSTFEIIVSDAGIIALEQHKGYKDGTPPPEAQKAYQQWHKAVESGKIKLNTEPLGETEASKEAMQHIPPLQQMIGYVPSEAAINACFDEYRLNKRRASLPTEGRKIAYEPDSEDGYQQSHFIAGYAEVTKDGTPTGQHGLHPEDVALADGNHLVDLRKLDALSFARATGMLEAGREIIRRKLPELAKVLEADWQAQDALPIKERPLPTPKAQIQRAQAEHHATLRVQEKREMQESGSSARY